MYTVQGNEELYIHELKIYPIESHIHVYTLYVGGERPVYYNNSMILFFDVNCAGKALLCSNCGAALIKSVPKDKSFTFDFYEVLQTLSNPSEEHVRNSMLLDCLNLMEDYCFDTMDFWTDEHKTHVSQTEKNIKKIQPGTGNEPVYMTPISPLESIKDGFDFFRKIFSAARYFFTETDIDQHFRDVDYDRKELVKAMKYVIGDVATSAIFIN
jgi:hypothetical protein